MSNSGLTIFLPIVAAFVGAIIGAWANSWYRNREVMKAEVQELKAILLLISAEVYVNDLTLRRGLREGPARSWVARGLFTNVWDQSHVRLANLLTTHEVAAFEVAALAEYYAAVNFTRVLFEKLDQPELSEGDKKSIAIIRERGAIVRDIAQDHLSDPSLFKIPFDEDQSKNAEDEREDPKKPA
jgi:hypothetical protein